MICSVWIVETILKHLAKSILLFIKFRYIDEMRAMYDRSFEMCELNCENITKLKDECITRVDAQIERKVIRLRELNANFEGFEFAKPEEDKKEEAIEEKVTVEKPPTPQETKRPDPKKGQAAKNVKVVEEAPKEEEVKEEEKEKEVIPPRTIESDLENFVNPIRQNILETQEKLINHVMDFILERDQRQHDVCINVGLFILDFGKRFDLYIQEEAEMDHQYEIDKAVVEDNDNESLENLGEKLDTSKMELRQAVDHLELDKRLETCFEIIEEIENEFRTFHQSNLDVTKKRQPMIDTLFEKFETSVLQRFGLVSIEDKEKLTERNDKFAKLKAKKAAIENEKKALVDEERLAAEEAVNNKDKKGGGKVQAGKGKDPKKAQQEREEAEKLLYSQLLIKIIQMDDVGLGRAWLVSISMEALVKGMFQKAPEEEDEAQKQKEKEEQEKLRLEKEQREREEAEELAKDPKKAAAKAKEKAAQQTAAGEINEEELENINDPEDREVGNLFL